MGESHHARGSEDEDGNQTMFDFEGGPCLNVGGTINYYGSEFKIVSIKPEEVSRKKTFPLNHIRGKNLMEEKYLSHILVIQTHKYGYRVVKENLYLHQRY